ncbi:unnamed protein product [Lampetra fluviatilis]
MSVTLVALRLELSPDSNFPSHFQRCHSEYSAYSVYSELSVADSAMSSSDSAMELRAEIQRSLGSREMHNISIETVTFNHEGGTGGGVLQGSAPFPAPTERVSAALPDEIPFFSGNPSVEIVHGVMHLYKTRWVSVCVSPVSPSLALLCMLAVPSSTTSHELLRFLGPAVDSLQHVKVVRDSTPNFYMVLLHFLTQASADEFYGEFNGRRFNSIEEDVCQLVHLQRADAMRSDQGASLPVMGLTELPPCIVCLERMDESVKGVLTVLCNHAFHTQCLQHWEDTTCPVCRYCQTPEPVEENRCFECGVQENLWICLICGHIGCGRYVSRHAYTHFQLTMHTYAMQLTNQRVWDYAGDNYVHRLVASKADGKAVQFECEGAPCMDEKIDALQLEYSYLLTSQLESQRIYWEGKLTRLEKDVSEEMVNVKAKFKETLERCDSLEQKLNTLAKEKQSLERKCATLTQRQARLASDLDTERELNRCLRSNQTSLQQASASESARQRARADELSEQLRDVTFALEAGHLLARLAPEERAEVMEGSVELPAPVTDGGGGGGGGGGRGRRGRGRRGR